MGDFAGKVDCNDELGLSTQSVHRAPHAANTHNNSQHSTRGATRQAPQHQEEQSPPTEPPPHPTPQHPRQQQQRQQKQQKQQPPPDDTAPTVCRGINARGANAGKICGKRAGLRVPGLCKHHDGQQKRRRQAPDAAREGAAGANEQQANYSSRDELVGGVDELHTPGAGSKQQSKLKAAHQKGESIANPGFKSAQKGPGPPKPKVLSYALYTWLLGAAVTWGLPLLLVLCTA